MSKASRIKLSVLGAVGLVAPIFLMLSVFGVPVTAEEGLAVGVVVSGVGNVVLAALGIQTQNGSPPEPPK